MASPPPSRIGGEQRLPPAEILEDIFLRLDSGFDLARASTICRAFHRVATDRSFLRRFLSLHPPPIVGFKEFSGDRGLIQAEAPHRSAPAARAIAQAGDFTFSFIPRSSDPINKWCISDARDGRFLLSREGAVLTDFLELVVCDPLYRQYAQIPPIPRDIVPRVPSSAKMYSQPFLAPSEEVVSEEHSNFHIIYNWLSDYKVVSFVYSSATGKWRCATSFGFLPARLIGNLTKYRRFYAHSCFFWVSRIRPGEYMLMLNTREMKFTIVELLCGDIVPPMREAVIIEAAENRLGFLTVDARTVVIYSETCPNNGIGREDWRRDIVIPLPEEYSCYQIISAAEGYLLLKGVLSSLLNKPPDPSVQLQKECFAVDLKTFLVERLCMLNGRGYLSARPYASFPPPLSPPAL